MLKAIDNGLLLRMVDTIRRPGVSLTASVLPAQENGNDDNHKGQGREVGRKAGTTCKIARGTLRAIAKLQLMAGADCTGI